MFFGNFTANPARFFSRSRRAKPDTEDAVTVAAMDVRELARRTVARDAVDFHTVLTIPSIGAVDARIMDISPYGFQARAGSRLLDRGERITARFPVLNELNADVMWALKGLFGCKFSEPIDPEFYAELLAAIRLPAHGPAEATAG
jgi:hypothetical protein